MSVTDFTVEYTNRKAVKGFIEKHHYSQNINGVSDDVRLSKRRGLLEYL